ncbi:enoyl-CoA delta isomerase 1, mitochondrial [Heteronotia binoei]|uniref:enoyl-CoA delta isomerase 1, mitochondrial n=1 Tax=Heteronotia binoei TaxID=13085 RepID=UPI00292EFD7F|nr:enoyl-CoA delta isomerase 1, mitochondrial [Heteronotia binoei]
MNSNPAFCIYVESPFFAEVGHIKECNPSCSTREPGSDAGGRGLQTRGGASNELSKASRNEQHLPNDQDLRRQSRNFSEPSALCRRRERDSLRKAAPCRCCRPLGLPLALQPCPGPLGPLSGSPALQSAQAWPPGGAGALEEALGLQRPRAQEGGGGGGSTARRLWPPPFPGAVGWLRRWRARRRGLGGCPSCAQVPPLPAPPRPGCWRARAGGGWQQQQGLAAAGLLCLAGLWSGAGARRPFSNDKVLVELDESTGVAVMKLKSPPVNSLSLELLTEFSISLEKLENDKACRGIILTSVVPKIFSAGLDITEMHGKSKEHYAEFWKAVQEMWLKLYDSRLAMVAAINGSSPAGGCLMALSCDYRIMAENPKYRIGLNETQLGIIAPFWFKDVMISTVGHRAAERSLQLGLLYSAPDALKLGLVDQLVPEEKMESAATQVMAQWLATPDHARQITKSMMRKKAVERLHKHRDSDIQNFVDFISRDSIQKSLQMYIEMLKQRKA